MASRTGRMITVVVAILVLLVGLLWVGQGLGILGGSAMSGAMQWFWVGLVLVVAAVVLLVRGLRRTRVPR